MASEPGSNFDRGPAAGPAEVAPRATPTLPYDAEAAYEIDRTLCAKHYDNSCHRDRLDGMRLPHRWSSGAAGLDWPGRGPKSGVLLAKLSLEGNRWIAEAWFAPEIDELVDDEEGRQRPSDPLAVVDTGVARDERDFELEPVVAFGYADGGALFVAGSVSDVPGAAKVRRLEGTFLRWDQSEQRFAPTGKMKITSTRWKREKTFKSGW